jgi:AcrR family transcriptional regulator
LLHGPIGEERTKMPERTVLPDDVASAIVEAIRRRGIDGFSVEHVAELTGLDPMTVCERWGEKEELAVRGLAAHYDSSIPIPDTGCLRDDVVAFTHAVARFLTDSTGRLLMRLLVVDDRDWGAGDARVGFWQIRFQRVKTMFERAERRGEIRAGVNYQVAMQMMIAPLHAHALYTEDAIDEHMVNAIIEMAWPAIAAAAFPASDR